MIHTDGRHTIANDPRRNYGKLETDPNECPCTTGHNSFDGKTLAELGNEQPCCDGYCEPGACVCPLASDDDDGHLESDAWHDRHDPQGCPQCEFEADEAQRLAHESGDA